MDENISKQILAMGFPSARIMLYALAKKFGKEYVGPRIEEICHIQEVGFMNIDFYNKFEDKKDNIMVILKECDKNHNLSDQLNKLMVHLDTEKWKDVLKSLSTVILLARNIYTSIYENNLDLITEIIGTENMDIYRKLQVDPLNTTLYLPDVEDRIGIFFENT